jgi:hypothetical protein
MNGRNAETAAKLIRRYFPEVRAEVLEELPHFGWGGDSDAFLVDETHVFRFARHEEIRRGYAVEACLLPKLAARLAEAGVDVGVPRFSHVGFPAGSSGVRDAAATGAASATTTAGLQGYGNEAAHDDLHGEAPLFVGYPLVPGRQLTPAGLERLIQEEGTGPDSAFDEIARGLGTFLTVLHQTPLEAVRACGVTETRIPLWEQVDRQHARIRSHVYPVLDPGARLFLDRLFDAFLGNARYTDRPLTLCHGDLSSDHILVEGQGGRLRLSGVIDFGDVCIGDPSGDFAAWRGEYGDEFFWRVLESYPGTAEEKRILADVANFRRALMPTVEIGYGIDTGNRDYVEEGKAALAEIMRRLETHPA